MGFAARNACVINMDKSRNYKLVDYHDKAFREKIDDEANVVYSPEYQESIAQNIESLQQGYKLFRIEADYRSNNENPPVYYVLEKSKIAARKRIRAVLRFHIYSSEEVEHEEAVKILSDPIKYCLFT